MKQSKKLFLILLLALLIAALVTVVSAEGPTVVDTGNCGNNLTWTLDTNDTLTIDGEGAMCDFDHVLDIDEYRTDAPWGSYFKTIKSVIIGNCVTSIGCDAFYGCSSLENASLGFRLDLIGDGAFCSCSSLKSIVIPDNVKTIGQSAFHFCYNLSNVEMGSGVLTIGSFAFYDCWSLESISIPDGVTSIEYDTFCFCCNLSVSIPKSVVSIANEAFLFTKNIIVDEDNPFFASEEGVLFNKDKTELLQYPGANPRTTYVVPDSVITIKSGAFCWSLFSNVVLPKSVSTIESHGFWICALVDSITIKGMQTEFDDLAVGTSFLQLVNVPDELKREVALLLFVGVGESTEATYPYYENPENYLLYPDSESGEAYFYVGTIHCHSGSTAEAYAQETGMDYELVHFYDELVSSKAPTCTTQGYSVYKCIYCDKTETRDYTDPLGHDYIDHAAQAPTCTNIGWNAYQTCSRCDYTSYVEKDPLRHDYAAVVTPPSCNKQGYTTYTCRRGDDTFVVDYTAPLGHIDEGNDGRCDRCGTQMTGGDHCKFCGKIHNGGFFDKLTGFFHKLFAVFQK